ncbi:hypothetical protein HDU98_006747 [Podochytrium sp. JEL0797]|nr:hypothetical protein HDU98_006747 [Podochytrium sp. JEL0797]
MHFPLLLVSLLVLVSTITAIPAGKVTSFELVSPAETTQFRITTETTTTLLSLLGPDTFRLQTVLSGQELVEPQDPSIVVKQTWPKVETHVENTQNEIVIRWADGAYLLHLHKSPFSVSVMGPSGVVFQESMPLDVGENQTTQFLTHNSTEQFFGGGMQNGRFTHKGHAIRIERSENWDDGGTPNAAPFYMSTKGYGVFRNTFSPGVYDFTSPTQPLIATHNESRFDEFVFLSDSLKRILTLYTQVTGRPFLPPMYGLELGDSDCYLHNANRGERHTLAYTTEIADGYVQNDMPVGWLLVNDGYGCGYENLPETAQVLAERNISMGLWTESDLTNQPYEVQKGQVRIRKLDVAWIGAGYEFALKGCETAFNGIEEWSDARGFVWTVEGWSGTQRCSVMWTGDQKGTWDNVRFHIPTLQGAGLSGQAWTSGDVDGIWWGSADTYVRDLQHKVFAPVVMSMSGWAPVDKQPWRYGEPYTSINRKYLKLRESLLPYLYTFAAEAHLTGVPPIRALILEYPNDPITWTTAVENQFLFGTQFLVAPVFTDTVTRDGIYLPDGTWYDYWTGRKYHGNQVLNSFPAPLDTLPLFVKAGSIIPMWGNVNSFREVQASDDLILDLYPSVGETNSFSLYEDDMVTRQHRVGAFTHQNFTMKATRTSVYFEIGAISGEYDGQPAQRGYQLKIHTGGREADRCNFKYTVVKSGVLLIRVPTVAADVSASVILSFKSKGNVFVKQD